MWFHSIFINKRVEKKEHPPPLKPKRVRSKESRERFLKRRAEKRAKDRLVPSEQRLLEERINRVEEKPSIVRYRGGVLPDDPNLCKVCKRSFQRLLKHLGSSADCAQEYDLEKLHRENKAKIDAKRVENRRNKREAERAEDEPAVKKRAAAVKKGQRGALRAQNEEEFKAKRAAEIKHTRVSLRAQNEEEFKAKRAAEKE